MLLDAPCSSTGTIRRHPDVPWLKSEADLSVLTLLQQRLLDRAVELLKPGATFIYCVCSLEPEEGENQIAALLARDPRIVRKPIAAQDVFGPGEFVTIDGDLRMLPLHLPDPTRVGAGSMAFMLHASPEKQRSPLFGPTYWPFPDPSLSCGPRVRTGTRGRGRAL